MAKGIYERTKEHGLNISKAKKGKRTSIATEFKKGHTRLRSLNSYRNKEYRNQLSNSLTRCSVDDNFFSKYTKQSCYYAGLLSADGNIFKNYITLGLKDKKHVELFKKRLKSTYKISALNKSSFYRTIIHSYQIVQDLKKYFNIVPNKSYKLIYPLKMPKKLNKYFIRGFFDGDGSLKKFNGYWRLSFSSCSLSFLKRIKNILQTNCYLQSTRKFYKYNNCYTLPYTQYNDIKNIMNFLNISLSLKRKNLKEVL